jgi:hypothetical protein
MVFQHNSEVDEYFLHFVRVDGATLVRVIPGRKGGRVEGRKGGRKARGG